MTKIIKISLLITAVFALIITAYLFYLSANQIEFQLNLLTFSRKPAASHNNWNSFTDQSHGIDFNYPNNWTIVELDDAAAGLALRSPDFTPISDDNLTLEGEIYITTLPNPANLDIESLFKTFNDTARFWFDTYPSEVFDHPSLEGVIFKDIQESEQVNPQTKIYLVCQSKIVALSYIHPTSQYQPELTKIASSVTCHLPPTMDKQAVTAQIGSTGGQISIKDELGQTITAIIPAGAVNQEIDFELSLEENNVAVAAGEKSELKFSLTPNLSFEEPITLEVSYDPESAPVGFDMIVPYRVGANNQLSMANLLDLEPANNKFSLQTWQTGTYLWVYITGL